MLADPEAMLTLPVRITGAGTVCAREASPSELASWDAIVARFSNHRIVHERCWMRYLESSVRGRPLFLVFERAGDIVGCLPGLLTRLGPLRMFGSPLPGWQTGSMGPTFDPEQISTDELMASAIALLERRFGVHHIEMINGNLDARAMRALGFRPECIPTFRALLCPSNPEHTLSRMTPTARRNIRRAIRLGLRPQFERDEAFVDEAHDQMKEVFLRGGNIIPFGRQRVLHFFRHMRDAGNLVAISVCLPDTPVSIATGLFTIAGQELYLWQWAHRTQYRWYRPTELMTWTVMQRAMEAGCTTFDLMGEGVFKTKFGAERDASQFRWVRSRWAWLTQLRDLAERGYRWQQSARGALGHARRFGRSPRDGSESNADA